MRTITRNFKNFVKEFSSTEFASEEELKKELEKHGYHVVRTSRNGRFVFALCIYIRNLSPELRELAKKTKYPEMGETIRVPGLLGEKDK